MKATIGILGCLMAALFGAGCATTPGQAVSPEFRKILFRYHTQSYDLCVEEIDQALARRPNGEQRAHLLMLKGMCAEEAGRETEAGFLYQQVLAEFALTRHADAARRRISGTDGDQREHLELKLSDPTWRRALKLCDDKHVVRIWVPFGQTPKQRTLELATSSTDRLPEIQTLDELTARAEAEFALNGGTVRRHSLQRTTNEEYWEAVVTNAKAKGTEVSLGRSLLTPGRIHFIRITARKPSFTTEERERYLGMLRQATLVGP